MDKIVGEQFACRDNFSLKPTGEISRLNARKKPKILIFKPQNFVQHSVSKNPKIREKVSKLLNHIHIFCVIYTLCLGISFEFTKFLIRPTIVKNKQSITTNSITLYKFSFQISTYGSLANKFIKSRISKDRLFVNHQYQLVPEILTNPQYKASPKKLRNTPQWNPHIYLEPKNIQFKTFLTGYHIV